MESKDVATITNLFSAKAHIENTSDELTLLLNECFEGGKAWADMAAKFTVSNGMVGSGMDASEVCVVMIMTDAANPNKAIWSMHLLKVEQIDSKYQITGMKVTECSGFGL